MYRFNDSHLKLCSVKLVAILVGAIEGRSCPLQRNREKRKGFLMSKETKNDSSCKELNQNNKSGEVKFNEKEVAIPLIPFCNKDFPEEGYSN